MAIPKVNVDAVADGIIGVQVAMLAALGKFGEAMVAFFLDLAPERGEKLWVRFRAFQRDKGDDVGFPDFVQSVVTADPIKLFYPKECTLDVGTRQMLVGEIQKGIRLCNSKSNADVLQIYFGEGAVYNVARQISCKGCPQARCRHYLGSRRR